jgi:acyl-coenzyme A synthetase/AMP-(fatty) acid ligase
MSYHTPTPIQKIIRQCIIIYLYLFKRLNSIRAVILFGFKRNNERQIAIQSETGDVLYYAEAEQQAYNIIDYLQKHNIVSGDVIGYYSPNSTDYFSVRAAAHIGGYRFFPVPLSLSLEALFHFIEKLNVRALFMRDTDNCTCHDIRNHTSQCLVVNLASSDYSSIIKRAPLRIQLDNVSGSSIASYNLSSGTTQKTPKIVGLTQKNWLSSVFSYVRGSQSPPGSQARFLCAISYMTAGSTSFLPAILGGATHIVIKNDYSAERLAEVIKKYTVSHVFMTPSNFLKLFRWCQDKEERLESLESIILGTEYMPAKRFAEAVQFYGPRFTIGYGMVEALPPLTLLDGRFYMNNGERQDVYLSSVGKAVRGVNIRIVDDGGQALSPGKIGRIMIRSKTISSGYIDNAALTQKAFRNGWFLSSDYGYMDADGFLYVMGREEDIVAENEGRPVFARELEDPLYNETFLKQCAVIRRNDKLYVYAAIDEANKVERYRAALRDACQKYYPPGILPEEIYILESLPLTLLGKLNRKELI